MTSHEFALKIANIFDNDTEFKDIYDYVLKQICNKNEEFKKIINRKIIKKIIMPGVYGQKTITMLEECEKELDLIENSKNKKKILLEVEKEC
jgi:DNA-dependent RNA polymerase